MIWGAFSYNGKTPICFLSARMDYLKYIERLEDTLIENADNIAGPNRGFKQDMVR